MNVQQVSIIFSEDKKNYSSSEQRQEILVTIRQRCFISAINLVRRMEALEFDIPIHEYILKRDRLSTLHSFN